MNVAVIVGAFPLDKSGGSEYQALILAQGLAARGHRVSYIALASAESSNYQWNGIDVYKYSGERTSNPQKVRSDLVALLKLIKPDLCYIRNFKRLHLVSLACRELRIPYISTSCSKYETLPLVPQKQHPSWAANHYLSFRAIKFSIAHVTVTQNFSTSVQRWYPGKKILHIYNGSPVPDNNWQKGSKDEDKLIWVNNLKKEKRPDIFVDLARQFPQYQFTMIGRMNAGRYGDYCQRILANRSPNLQYLGELPLETVNSLIQESQILLYTSTTRFEGFGNSLIQAWLREVPTCSLSYDPDSIIQNQKLGRVSHSFGQLVSDVGELMKNKDLLRDIGRRAREYAVRYHSSDRMVRDYETLFQQIL